MENKDHVVVAVFDNRHPEVYGPFTKTEASKAMWHVSGKYAPDHHMTDVYAIRMDAKLP